MTGAAGRVASGIRPLLLARGWELVLLDVDAPAELASGERFVAADVRDGSALRRAFAGVDGVVHLGGVPSERSWDVIHDVNVLGTRAVLEAMVDAGVHRLFHASSVHASGFEPADAPTLAAPSDSFYGVGKLAAEAMVSVYADRFGLSAVSARIASYGPQPANVRALAMWLSPGDAARLVAAALTWDGPGHAVVWGVSANTRSPLDPEPGRAIGYHPLDDAEAHAHTVAPAGEEPLDRLGAGFCVRPLGIRGGR
nr:NAD(P)-dependent oxidoreductase [Propioniciclava soli]